MLERTPDIDIVLDGHHDAGHGWLRDDAGHAQAAARTPTFRSSPSPPRSRRASASAASTPARPPTSRSPSTRRSLLVVLGEWLPEPRLPAGHAATADGSSGADRARAPRPRLPCSWSTTTRRKRLAIQAMLEPLGHTVVEADSGRAALRAVMDRRFAVILMDVQMPTMDGYETARLIRKRSESEHTPIIFITAFGRDETRDRGRLRQRRRRLHLRADPGRHPAGEGVDLRRPLPCSPRSFSSSLDVDHCAEHRDARPARRAPPSSATTTPA